MRYHAKRRDFFQNLNSLNTWLTGLSGGGTGLSAFLGTPLLTQILGACVFFLAAADRAIRFSQKAKRHDELYGQFADLSKKIISTKTPTEKHLIEFKAHQTEIEKKEPSALAVLNILCRNEVALERGAPEYVVPLRWWQRAFAQFVSLPPRNWEKQAAGYN